MKEKLKKYFGVLVPEKIDKSKLIYLLADEAQVLPSGDLCFWKHNDDGHSTQIIFSISKGMWEVFFAASLFDGAPCCIEHWPSLKEEKK